MNKNLFKTVEMEEYLKCTKLINFESPEVIELVNKLALNCSDKIASIKKAFEFVRDNYAHTFDINGEGVARSASDVINLGHGICYAKAHLLAALLRAIGVPTGICYQRLLLLSPEEISALEAKDAVSGSRSAAQATDVAFGFSNVPSGVTVPSGLYAAPSQQSPSLAEKIQLPPANKMVLHAVNVIFIESLNKWIRLDARGNKPGVDAQFSLDHEQLAFTVHPQLGEEDSFVVYSDTPKEVAHFFEICQTAQQLKANLPSYILDDSSILFTTKRAEKVMEFGQGMYIWDTEGNKYLDFVGGWAVNCLGHSPKVIADALTKQATELVNCSPAYYNPPMLKFAKLLTQYSCFDKVFFGSTGAEANESAIKLARKYGSKELNGAYEIITTVGSFHGRTLATMSATGKKQWESLFAPKVPGFIHVPFNDAEAVKAAITDKTCAIMLEPVQGEGGVNVADVNYIKKLREICDENNILLIFDEVQTGLGRIGNLFAYKNYGIEPDIMTLGKGIGGGFPLSAMLTKKQFDIFEPGDQGGSYCSQPLAMSVGYAVVSEIINKDLPAHAEKLGKYILEKLDQIKDKYQLSNLRGKGLLLAFDVAKPNASEIVAQALSKGLILNSPQPSTIRLIPPLIVTEAEVDEMLNILTSLL